MENIILFDSSCKLKGKKRKTGGEKGGGETKEEEKEREDLAGNNTSGIQSIPHLTKQAQWMTRNSVHSDAHRGNDKTMNLLIFICKLPTIYQRVLCLAISKGNAETTNRSQASRVLAPA